MICRSELGCARAEVQGVRQVMHRSGVCVCVVTIFAWLIFNLEQKEKEKRIATTTNLEGNQSLQMSLISRSSSSDRKCSALCVL